MISYQYKDLIIEVFNERTYTLNSTDNNFKYSNHYFGEDGEFHPTSKHGIKITQNQNVVYDCILIASGGATGIHETSAILDGDHLLVCCCNTIFCLLLPELELKWKVQADFATCFQIFKHQNDYIVHGELQITKLDKDGNKKWEFIGSDIFVSMDGEQEFKLEDDGILLTDFEKTKYKIDYDGKLIWKA